MNYLFDFIIYGEPASKGNSRRVARNGMFIKSKKAMDYKESFENQAKEKKLYQDVLIEDDIELIVDVWYKSRRPDLEIELIQDIMQGIIYKNDRQIKKKIAERFLDRDNPRARIRIKKYNAKT